MAAKPPRVPRYVQACISGAWHIRADLYDPLTGEIRTGRWPYKCHSWRHAGECRRWRAAQNFSRLAKALAVCRPRDVLLLVLTLDVRRQELAKRSRFHAFRDLVGQWTAFARALKREFGEYRYASTVEVTKQGWPHLNVILVSPVVADAHSDRAAHLRAWIRRHAVSCGFGPIHYVERAKGRRALVGYVVKLASDIEGLGAIAGEVTKTTSSKAYQVPEQAPPHFRRLRYTRGWLEKPYSGKFTLDGQLIRAPLPTVGNDRSNTPDSSGHTAPVRSYRF